MREPVLNRQLVLETPQLSPDGAGGHVTSWQVLGSLWAEMRAGTGRERADGELPVAQQMWRITVPAAPYGAPSRPRPEQRFREGVRIFRILSVAEADPEGRFLTCIAKEEVLT